MKLEIINTLSESTLFRSKDQLDKFPPAQNSNLLYLYLLSLFALLHDDSLKSKAQSYIARTTAFNNFDYFRTAGTDLYMLAHTLNDNKFFNEKEFIRYLLEIKQGKYNNFYMYMSKLERALIIKNPIYKNVKRVFANWDTEKQSHLDLQVRTLYREIYNISSKAEILRPLSELKR